MSMPRQSDPRRLVRASSNIASKKRTDANSDSDSSISEEDDFDDMDGFQIPRALPRCDERKYTLRQLMMLLNTPDGIDLDPVYQRGFVWNYERQVGIVNSIFQGYYIPGLIFNKRVHHVFGMRNEVLVCIDGKQRLSSVKRFTEGLIPCTDRNGQSWYFRRPDQAPHNRRQYLPHAAQAIFWNKTFSCNEYVGMTEDQEHELFERVQRGNPLTPAEKSQAKRGDWQDLARAFQQDYLLVSKLSENKRGAGHNKFISSFLQLLENDEARAKGREILFRGTNYWVERWFGNSSEDHPCTPTLLKRMRNIFDRYEVIAKNHKHAFENDGLNKKNTLAPIEFIAIAVMLDEYERASDAELETAIRNMRRKVRQVHSDNVRRKQMVWDTLIESIASSLSNVAADRHLGNTTTNGAQKVTAQDASNARPTPPQDISDEAYVRDSLASLEPRPGALFTSPSTKPTPKVAPQRPSRPLNGSIAANVRSQLASLTETLQARQGTPNLVAKRAVGPHNEGDESASNAKRIKREHS